VPWLKKHVVPIHPPDRRRLERWLADLDSPQFAVRFVIDNLNGVFFSRPIVISFPLRFCLTSLPPEEVSENPGARASGPMP
jgi:hypothetical protein